MNVTTCMARGLPAPALVVVVALIAGLAFPGGADAARIKCWKNSESVRECGNVVPPEYAQQGHRELNKSGLTVKRQSAPVSREQREAERQAKLEQEKREREERRRYTLQAAEDRVLLDTFVTESNLTLAHERQRNAIQSNIEHRRSHIEKLEESLEKFQRKAADQERSGQKVSQKTLDNISDVQRQIDDSEAFIRMQNAEIERLEAEYRRDLARYRYLKEDASRIGSPVQS